MYFVILFVLVWLWFWWKADKTRIAEIYGAVVFTCFLGLLTDLIMVHYKLWAYCGLPKPLFTVPLSLDFGIYPVVAYLFVQNLPQHWPGIWRRTILWMIPSLLFEVVTLKLGYIQHLQWWNIWLSGVSDVIIYLSIAVVYRYYSPVYVSESKEYIEQFAE